MKSIICAAAMGAALLVSTVQAEEMQTQIPESYIALLRSDLRTRKTAIITENLLLTDEQSKKFWPLQRNYEVDLDKLGDKRFEIVRDYAKSWNNFRDDNAKDLGKRLIDYHKKRIELQGKYFNQMSKEVSPIIAAKFFQIENQIEEIIDLGMASSVPLIQQTSER